MNNSLFYNISLTLIPGVGSVLAKKLLKFCGSAEAVFSERKKMLTKISGIGQTIAEAIATHSVQQQVEAEIAFIEKYGIIPLFYTDQAYPIRLHDCYDAPIMLYYKGTENLNTKKILAVVGTRTPTIYGKEICEKIISELSQDTLIISGLAYGIDASSHRAAIKNSMNTVGVLAHGLDMLYPAQNKQLAQEMLQQGGLITEYMSKTPLSKENFPQRNRIVAGLADAVLVIETAKKGGSLITASIANSYNRDVFTVPGRIIDNKSAGCNWLIHTNQAVLVENGNQIKEILGWDDEAPTTGIIQKSLFPTLSPDEQIIYDLLKTNGESSFDFIIHNTEMNASKISAALLNMEFDGIIKVLPGKIYNLS